MMTLDPWDTMIIVGHLQAPRRLWLAEYERAAGKGEHTQADYALDQVQVFDRLIKSVCAVTRPFGKDV